MNELILSIIAALVVVESHGNRNAVGDGGAAIGILQIHSIMVDEANRLAGAHLFDVVDRWDPEKSREMAQLVLSRRLHLAGHTEPTEEAARYAIGLWNRGDVYYQKVLKELNR